MLIEILEKQLALHKSLLQLAQAKADAVKQNKMDELNRIVRDEQKHVNAVSILEKRRTGQLKGQLSSFLATLSPEKQRAAEALRDELVEVIVKLKEANDLNAELLDQSLQFVHLQLDLLAPPEAANYAPGSDQDQPSLRPVFDSKA